MNTTTNTTNVVLLCTLKYLTVQACYELTKQDLLYIVIDIAKGMTAIHKTNVVHCDLKPSNILVKPLEGHSAFDEEQIDCMNCKLQNNGLW